MAIPLIILGGSDRRPGELPPAGQGLHPLGGYKGVDIEIAGRPLIAHVIERLRTCSVFDPISIAGPRSVYSAAVPGVSIVDVDGSVGHNIRIALQAVRQSYPSGPVAFTACDVVPEPAELARVTDDYRSGRRCDLWFPLIRVPADHRQLGASAWKPEYVISGEDDGRQTNVLPSHLAIVDPDALRLGLLYTLFDIAYRTRNRTVERRRRAFLRSLLLDLLYHDVLHLLSLRVPRITWTVVANGLRVAHRLRNGTLTRGELERAIGRIILKAPHRARYPDRGVRLPVLEGLSLAKDIDTQEESLAVANP